METDPECVAGSTSGTGGVMEPGHSDHDRRRAQRSCRERLDDPTVHRIGEAKIIGVDDETASFSDSCHATR
jgi:hypothetical protein